MLTGQRCCFTAAVLPFLLQRHIASSAVANPSVHSRSCETAGSRYNAGRRDNTRTLAGMSKRIEPGPGQESVWDYPRPPRVEQSSSKIEVELGGKVIASTTRAWRVLETSHPPVYYIPPEDIKMEELSSAGSKSSYCEWKGVARYYDAPGKPSIAWYYPEPTQLGAPLKNMVAFYPSKVDAAYVDGERIKPQAGDFYGGWITSKVVGPFKGEAGTMWW